MTNTISAKVYRTELREALQGMDGAEKLRAIRALRDFLPMAGASSDATLARFGQHVPSCPTIGHVSRLAAFLVRMVPTHLGAEHPKEVAATLDAVEDTLQDEHDRRKGAQGGGV